MLKVNENKIEKFYDVIDDSTMVLAEYTKKSYLECLSITSKNIISQSIDDVLVEDDEVLAKLQKIYEQIEELDFNNEEIRKAFQLAMLKGFKHNNANLSSITPDSIGILISYIVDKIFNKQTNISILDPTVGTGNLLMTLINNSELNYQQIYGVDNNYDFLNLALSITQLLDINIQFYHQNSLKPLMVPLVDLIISDLPVDDEEYYLLESLITAKNKIVYKPYLLVEHFMKYCKDGGYLIYLIPNNFFEYNKYEIIKDIIFKETYIQALIHLPSSLFKNHENQKSILILQKKGKNILPIKEILMLMFPSFKDADNVKKAIDKINEWHEKNNK